MEKEHKKHTIVWNEQTFHYMGKMATDIYLYAHEIPEYCFINDNNAEWWLWKDMYMSTFDSEGNPVIKEGVPDILSARKLFFKDFVEAEGSFELLFEKHVFTENEVHSILELLHDYFVCRSYAGMLTTDNEDSSQEYKKHTKKEYNRINKVVIPGILKSLYQIFKE